LIDWLIDWLKMAEIRHLENRHFFCRGWSDLDKISQTGTELRWCVEMETRCIIPIWRTFGRIQGHVIPELRITWWIQCHDSRATAHIAGVRIPSGILKIVFRHILFFLFIMLWRAAAFVSSPTHLLIQLQQLNKKNWIVFVYQISIPGLNDVELRNAPPAPRPSWHCLCWLRCSACDECGFRAGQQRLYRPYGL